ncbi:MAG: efflux RND transporter periplasmic adaptor subunit [Bdellovibrionales bacterium]|nr:efflux RND transporter periplasmic adaptor subunit [Ramlibacter sp.]
MKRWMKWALAAVIVALLASGAWRAVASRKAQQAALAEASANKAQVAVELAAGDVVTARTRELAQGLPISGSLRAVNSAIIKARVAGELQGLTVREGDNVKAGQVIARVDPIESQSRMRQAQQQAASAKAQIDIAQRQYDNNKALVDQGFISKTALDTSLANLNAAQANHNATLAAVDVSRKSMDDTVIRSPISGVVSQRLAQPGERVAIDGRVVEVVDLSRLELEASLSPADSVNVRVGQAASLQIEGTALAGNTGGSTGGSTGATAGAMRPISARVVRINPSTQAGSRSVLVYLGIDDATGLRQGLFAQGTLGTARASVLSVPLSAVRTDKPVPYVQAIENGKVVHKPVELGLRGAVGDETLVAVKGIVEGAVIVSATVGSLREGTAVKFTAAAGTAP